MPAWEFFHEKPIKQIKEAIRILQLYLEDTLNSPINAKTWENKTGEPLHYAVNALLLYKGSIEMLPKEIQPLAREELCLLSTEDLRALQEEMQTEALNKLAECPPVYRL